MTTKGKKSDALKVVENIIGGPLTFGRMMRSLRLCEEWSLADMAAKLKVTRARVFAIEKGTPVSPGKAAKYAKILGYDEDQFVQLALQCQLERDGLKYHVDITSVA